MRTTLALRGLGHISKLVQEAIDIRALTGMESVVLIFNELPLDIDEFATVQSVEADYDRMQKSHHYGEHCSNRR